MSAWFLDSELSPCIYDIIYGAAVLTSSFIS